MSWFGRHRDESAESAGFELVVPPSLRLSSVDVDRWVAAWTGAPPRSGARPLLASALVWEGPSPGREDEVPGTRVWRATPLRSGARPGPGDPTLETGFGTGNESIDLAVAGTDLVAMGSAAWERLTRRSAGRPDGGTEGAGPYALALVAVLARLSGGSVRRPGVDPGPPPPPVPTWSVYLDRCPRAAEVAESVADVLPDLAESGDGGDGAWLLESPGGRGVWCDAGLELIDPWSEDWPAGGSPLDAPLVAARRFAGRPCHAVRFEGAGDLAEGGDDSVLPAAARACARALGGLAVDPDGMPLDDG